MVQQGSILKNPNLIKLIQEELGRPEGSQSWRVWCQTCKSSWLWLSKLGNDLGADGMQARVCRCVMGKAPSQHSWILREAIINSCNQVVEAGRGKSKGKKAKCNSKKDLQEQQTNSQKSENSEQVQKEASSTTSAGTSQAPLSPGPGPWGTSQAMVVQSQQLGPPAPTRPRSPPPPVMRPPPPQEAQHARQLLLMQRLVGSGWSAHRSRSSGMTFWSHVGGHTQFEMPAEVQVVLLDIFSTGGPQQQQQQRGPAMPVLVPHSMVVRRDTFAQSWGA